MKLRGFLFTAIVCLFLCGPALLCGATRVGVEVPVELTAQPAQFLAGGAASADVGAILSIDGFAKKELQDAIETELGNYIPAKANAVMVNAAMQRGAIAASDMLCNWGCYQTYFGSERLFIEDQKAVTYLPEKRSENREEQWRTFAEDVAAAAARHPEKRFVMYVVGGYEMPAYNPAYALVSNPFEPSDCVNIMSNVLGDVSNVTILSSSYAGGDEYYADFFRTDHHWNIDGAFRAYGDITDVLGLEKVSEDGVREIPDYWFTGATARWGIDLLRERVFDCCNDFSNLVAMRTDGSMIRGDDHASFWDAPALGKQYRFYDLYYDNMGCCTITGGSGDRSALLVGNSYLGAIQRPLASSYRSLTVSSQLASGESAQESLEEQMNAAGASDVIFIANPMAFKVDEAYWE